MQASEDLSIVAVPGRGQDERVWGEFLPRLRRRYEVVLLDDAEELAIFTGDVILASSEAASAAVRAARNGRGRALALLAPILGEVLPEINLDLKARADEAFKMMAVMEEVASSEDPERRRSALADGMIRLQDADIPPADVARLHAMIRDFADRILDPHWVAMSRPAPYVEELAALDVPVLVLAAGGDRYAAAIGRALAGRAPRGELELLDTEQILYPWLARPDAAADAVIRFLAGL